MIHYRDHLLHQYEMGNLQTGILQTRIRKIHIGKARVYVDGERICTLDPREVGWIHCHAKLIFNDRESRPHKVEVNMEAGQEEKQFTILGFGYVP